MAAKASFVKKDWNSLRTKITTYLLTVLGSLIYIKYMGYAGKLEEKNLAISLRQKGLSYKEILQQVSVSKDTVSRWCKDIPLSEEQKFRLLNNKAFGQRKGSLIAAENKRRSRIERTEQIRQEAKIQLGNVTERDSFMVGIALYAAEGNKMDGKGGFANADPKLIKFMVEWLLLYTKMPRSRLRGAIWLHEGLDEGKAKDFWSEVTGLSLSQFNKIYITKSKIDSKKIRKNIHQHGVFTVRFSDSAVHRKIMGWIYAFFDGRIVLTEHSAIAQR